MDVPALDDDPASPERFELNVWPQTSERPWRAEVSVAGAPEQLRFERPMDLVIYLTRWSDASTKRGLR